ncbi:cytochrome c biogenesis protein DipZ [Candidatus Daviesbacteria bacterium]|nr:cytochrome c biogenesis protein DipZ [Candidatus Daviesbacteria bacterium]
MILLLLFAFISGLVTILAPCIWPLLPIILSSTTTGGHKKPLGITLGIMLSFGILTLTISYIVKIVPFDPNILRYFAVFVISLLGLTLVVPKLSAILESYVSRLSGSITFGNQNQSSGFGSGFITGLSLGVVWAPCAGPILATIATLAATQAVNLNVALVTIFYIIGVGIPLFIFATLGSFVFTKSHFLSKYTGRIQQIFGVIMILTAIAIATNYDKVLQAKLLDLFPEYSTALTSFESSQVVSSQLNSLKGKTQNTFQNPKALNIENMAGLPNLGPAPDFAGITKWLNPEKPLSIKDLKGKVVLVDFWTYTCINCIRTLPYVTGWYDKYKDQGFVVIGVHTPEFEFEKDTTNVLNAISQYKIHYPVAQDNNYSTWNAYSNRYWPAEYLIDANGNVRHTHFGEGEYDQTEKYIQSLLKEANKQVNESILNIPDQTPGGEMSPESYIGSARNQYIYPDGSVSNGTQNFTLANNLPVNHFSLGGQWTITDEYGTSGQSSVLDYNFLANKVFLVIHPPANQVAKVKVMLDGKDLDQLNAGDDVKDGLVIIDTPRLYNLINLQGKKGTYLLHLEFQTPGTQVFAFTFG